MKTTKNKNKKYVKSYPIVTDKYIDQVLKTGPRNITLSGAEHFTMDIKTHAANPSDYGVDEMRDWSIVNEK